MIDLIGERTYSVYRDVGGSTTLTFFGGACSCTIIDAEKEE
jgi:hypothetical protein